MLPIQKKEKKKSKLAELKLKKEIIISEKDQKEDTASMVDMEDMDLILKNMVAQKIGLDAKKKRWWKWKASLIKWLPSWLIKGSKICFLALKREFWKEKNQFLKLFLNWRIMELTAKDVQWTLLLESGTSALLVLTSIFAKIVKKKLIMSILFSRSRKFWIKTKNQKTSTKWKKYSKDSSNLVTTMEEALHHPIAKKNAIKNGKDINTTRKFGGLLIFMEDNTKAILNSQGSMRS